MDEAKTRINSSRYDAHACFRVDTGQRGHTPAGRTQRRNHHGEGEQDREEARACRGEPLIARQAEHRTDRRTPQEKDGLACG
jgi:hypothetical protein